MTIWKTMNKLEQDARAWIRRKSLPAFTAGGAAPFEVSLRWLPADDGSTTMWLCTCGLSEVAVVGKSVALVGMFDGNPAKKSDFGFHVTKMNLPGGSSWEIDAMLSAPLRTRTKDGTWLGSHIGNLAMLVNAFLFISLENVRDNGISASHALAGKLMPQDMPQDAPSWDSTNGPVPERRWYYRPFGTWFRSQTGMEWEKPGWLKPIPLYGQPIDPQSILPFADVDVDAHGERLLV